MAVSAQDRKAPSQAPGAGAVRGRLLQVHKPGDGTITRLSLFVVCLCFVLYTAHRFYYHWTALRNFLLKNILDPIGLGVLLNWSVESGPARTVAMLGAILLFVLGLFASYYYIYVHTKAAEFLVQTDGELRKVTWPKVVPWFRPDTQVWGWTYVVLVVVVFLALYVFGVDLVVNFLAQRAFYRD